MIKTTRWTRTLLILFLGFSGYILTSAFAAILLNNIHLGAAIGASFALAVAMLYKAKNPVEENSTPRFKTPLEGIGLTALLVTTAFLSGQALAMWGYAIFGSEKYDAITKVQDSTSVWLLLILGLIVAPLGEEALMRGLIYDRLRSHWSIWYAAIMSTAAFALLHGNLVQILAVIPLGMSLAFIYEAWNRSLIPAVLSHTLFNLLAMLIPVKTIASFTSSPISMTFITALWVGMLILFWEKTNMKEIAFKTR